MLTAQKVPAMHQGCQRLLKVGNLLLWVRSWKTSAGQRLPLYRIFKDLDWCLASE